MLQHRYTTNAGAYICSVSSYYEKKGKNINEVDVPFDVPYSWKWSTLGSLTLFGNFSSIKGTEIPNNSWVLDMEDIEKDSGRIIKKHYKTANDLFKSNKYFFNKNDVLYGKLRPYLRKVAIPDEAGFVTTEVFPIDVSKANSSKFFQLVMLSPYFYNLVNQSVYGVKMPRVGTAFLSGMVVPAVPKNDQIRIVKKVERLFESIAQLD
jgi:type I restriction enzyme S subunit